MPESLDVIAAVESAHQIVKSTPDDPYRSATITLAGQILVAQEIRRLTDAIKNETISVRKASSLCGCPC